MAANEKGSVGNFTSIEEPSPESSAVVCIPPFCQNCQLTQLTKLQQVSNKFDVFYSRENNPWTREVQCPTSSRALFPERFWARTSLFIEYTMLEEAT